MPVASLFFIFIYCNRMACFKLRQAASVSIVCLKRHGGRETAVSSSMSVHTTHRSHSPVMPIYTMSMKNIGSDKDEWGACRH